MLQHVPKNETRTEWKRHPTTLIRELQQVKQTTIVKEKDKRLHHKLACHHRLGSALAANIPLEQDTKSSAKTLQEPQDNATSVSKFCQITLELCSKLAAATCQARQVSIWCLETIQLPVPSVQLGRRGLNDIAEARPQVIAQILAEVLLQRNAVEVVAVLADRLCVPEQDAEEDQEQNNCQQ